MALSFTPLFALMLGVFELALPIFKKSTFSSAVREGCRYGTQTAAIKAVVQANAMGFLAGTRANDINVLACLALWIAR